jgi:hypothetical protein
VGLGPYSPDTPRTLLTGTLCPITIYGSLVTLLEFQMAPRLTIFNIILLQKGDQIHMPKRSQGFTPTKNTGRGFILCSTLPTQWAVRQPCWILWKREYLLPPPIKLTLSDPILLPPAYSPALIYFGQERGWWITCNYPTVLKAKNRNRKSTTCAIWWLKSVLHEEKERNRKIIMSDVG